jgi:hypothetical protein
MGAAATDAAAPPFSTRSVASVDIRFGGKKARQRCGRIGSGQWWELVRATPPAGSQRCWLCQAAAPSNSRTGSECKTEGIELQCSAEEGCAQSQSKKSDKQ